VDAPRCSPTFRSLDGSPLGSTARKRVWALVTLPLPWPPDIGDHSLLASSAIHTVKGLRLQGIAPMERGGPEERAVGDELLVIAYRRPPGPFARLERFEVTIAHHDLVDLLRHLADPAATGFEPVPAGRPVVDLAVCTHGSRDRCCGTDGTRLAAELARSLPAHVGLWRTSHTGGHRFAPTAMTFPDGRGWAWLDRELATTVALHDRPATTLAGHDRGSTGFDDPLTMAADAAVLQTEGWSWLDTTREAAVVGRDGPHATVLVRATSHHGSTTERLVGLEVAEGVPVPPCGEAPDRSTKTTESIRVRHVGTPVPG
jgi:hypothetical protein